MRQFIFCNTGLDMVGYMLVYRLYYTSDKNFPFAAKLQRFSKAKPKERTKMRLDIKYDPKHNPIREFRRNKYSKDNRYDEFGRIPEEEETESEDENEGVV